MTAISPIMTNETESAKEEFMEIHRVLSNEITIDPTSKD
jgi:hypothetical protein